MYFNPFYKVIDWVANRTVVKFGVNLIIPWIWLRISSGVQETMRRGDEELPRDDSGPAKWFKLVTMVQYGGRLDESGMPRKLQATGWSPIDDKPLGARGGLATLEIRKTYGWEDCQ